MIKRHRQQVGKFYRTNDRIFAQNLRVLDVEGKQLGIFSKDEALKRAREEGLDLVEIAPTAKPPVARIIDFKKFLYQEEKKRKEEKRKAKISETKEVRLGPFMDDHDLQVMTGRIREFLESNDKVKIVVRFRGRQVTHPEFGHQIMDKAIQAVSDISKIDRAKQFEGRSLMAIISPDRKGKKNEEESKEISQ